MARIRRLVLDLLKPHSPPTRKFASDVADLEGVAGVNAKLLETDKKVQNVKLTVQGEDVDYDEVEHVVSDLGGTLHSVDEVVCGDEVVDEIATHQD